MKILLIAPDNPDLIGLDSEIAAITDLHEVVPVLGIVRESDIVEAISHNPLGFEIMWWATHGSDLGVQISNEVLTADGVGQYLSASRARLCILNTCASEALARQIIVGTDSDLIYTISDVLDSDALRFGSLLANELSKTDNFREAFTHASPQRGRYRYLAAKAAIRALDMTVSSELQKLGAKVDETVRSAYQIQVDFKALQTAFAELRLQLTNLQQQFEIVRQQSQTRDMRDSLAKERQASENVDMGRRIEANVPAPVSVQQPISRSTWVMIILLSCILALVILYIGGKIF